MRLKRFLFPVIILFFSALKPVQAQKEGYLEVLGSVLTEGKGVEGASIKVLKGEENVDNFLSSSGGKFIINLDLNHLYTITFSKNGYITKSVLIDTKVPPEENTQIYSYKFKMELIKLPEGVPSPPEAEKAAAK